MAKYNIGGYIFEDENSAKMAAKELKAVEYILGQLKDVGDNDVLVVYKKLINQKMFSTDVGMGFLRQLRHNLLDSGSFEASDIPLVYSLEAPEDKASVLADNIEVDAVANNSVGNMASKDGYSHSDKEYRRLVVINSFLLVASITLLVCVCGMFYINSTINSPTILNYKETITNDFSSWKQQLEQREKELNERERLLDEREGLVGDINN